MKSYLFRGLFLEKNCIITFSLKHVINASFSGCEHVATRLVATMSEIPSKKGRRGGGGGREGGGNALLCQKLTRSVLHHSFVCTNAIYSAPPSFVCTNDQHAMYSTKGSSAPYNGETKKERNPISVERRAVRLLSRRYTLTATGYKFLEISINVGPPSYVEIALGDHRGQELILSLETWKGLYEQRWNIYKLLRNDYKDNFISVGPLTVRVCLMNNVTLVRLESLNVRITMIESTLRRMFDLDGCVDVTFDRLVRFVDTIDAKYTRFSNIASVITDPEEVPNAIRDCDTFDRRQLVDCELLALVFSV